MNNVYKANLTDIQSLQVTSYERPNNQQSNCDCLSVRMVLDVDRHNFIML